MPIVDDSIPVISGTPTAAQIKTLATPGTRFLYKGWMVTTSAYMFLLRCQKTPHRYVAVYCIERKSLDYGVPLLERGLAPSRRITLLTTIFSCFDVITDYHKDYSPYRPGKYYYWQPTVQTDKEG